VRWLSCWAYRNRLLSIAPSGVGTTSRQMFFASNRAFHSKPTECDRAPLSFAPRAWSIAWNSHKSCPMCWPIQADEQKFDEWVRTAQIPEGPVREGLRKMYPDYDQFGFPRKSSRSSLYPRSGAADFACLSLRARVGREPDPKKKFVKGNNLVEGSTAQ